MLHLIKQGLSIDNDKWQGATVRLGTSERDTTISVSFDNEASVILTEDFVSHCMELIMDERAKNKKGEVR